MHETVQNETYLGLEIYRFYIRCPRCISEITFKTDPENTDYVAEKGATRNFQAIKRAEDEEERLKKEREEEELNNPMKALENRTKESKQEMDILEKLEELRDLNARHASVDHELLLQQNMKYAKEIEERQAEEDEELVQSVFGKKRLEKRLESESSESDDESYKSNLKRQHNVESCSKNKATDVLVQDDEISIEPQRKKVKAWEKSVGTLKVSLGSLVKKKTIASDEKQRTLLLSMIAGIIKWD
ncbi:splicing factor YJU2-like isoform X2 [Xenia sp. Carnegie-2017]|uniref:splicing factor YJU2-like isoform X2 n=1 Tax=Xenia sp. Carnegie-2017 TaxID=2897299 RepID=UPI001F03EEF6|nr:splicing factor YJU2-like isoform X2 [Xenia sp. Carnegie-2017]XP_046845344.1 splicing factor YJU2-like isoform X2 [Xenia sp. Carnegie-2017]